MNKEDVAIKLDSVHKSYFLANGEEIPVLKGVSLEIKRGEFVAIMGESGGGKTTLLHIIGCLHPLSDGKYYLEGEDISSVKDDYTLAFIRNKRMGFVFQSFNLFTRLTALKNVALPALYAGEDKKSREARAFEMLKSVGLEDRTNHKPTELSGGQQQRVTISRALINEPDIILADEPTGALDTKSGEEIMKIFSSLQKEKGKTLVMVTHEANIARYADRIIFMRDGKVLSHDYKI